jgi:hypothetical protein
MKFKDIIFNIFGQRIYSFFKKIYLFFTDLRRVPTAYSFDYQDYKSKELHILNCFRIIQSQEINDLPQTYFEFGCHSGRTFSSAINSSKFLNLNNFKFYAFDSFQGLPKTTKEDGSFFKTGEYYTSKKTFLNIIRRNTGVNSSDINVVEGFYESSLTNELSKRLPKAGIIYIDCDLYSSTKNVLDFLKNHITNGTIIMLDDYYCASKVGHIKGQRHAFENFIRSENTYNFEHYKNYSDFGAIFFVNKR